MNRKELLKALRRERDNAWKRYNWASENLWCLDWDKEFWEANELEAKEGKEYRLTQQIEAVIAYLVEQEEKG